MRKIRFATCRHHSFQLLVVMLACFGFLQSPLLADQVHVRFPEGNLRGFLAVHNLDGELLANGQMVQSARKDQVTIHLNFKFKDGSVYDESTVFAQRDFFRLLSDHLIEQGPSFRHPIEAQVDASTGQITVRYLSNGKEKTIRNHFEMPSDVANGLLFALVEEISPAAPQTTLSYVAFTPKPRLVKLVITPHGEATVSDGTIKLKAVHYLIRAKIGGISGLIVGLLGRPLPDLQMWVVEGKLPAIVKFQGSLYYGGPEWLITPSTPAVVRSHN